VAERGHQDREYLFELFEARAAIYGRQGPGRIPRLRPEMSLKDAGWLDKPSAPMLLINGMKDSQVPVEDVFLLMRSGSPKEVWINPQGGHMGRNKEISDQKIFETVTCRGWCGCCASPVETTAI